MQDELEDKREEYLSIPHRELCDLMSTMKVKYNSKMDAACINSLATSKEGSINSDRNVSIRLRCNKKVNTGTLSRHSIEKIPPSTIGRRAIAFFAIRHECLSKITSHIAPKTSSENDPTNHLSRKDWEDP